MPKYTTGEIAKLCNISVRTVQFYDTKNLLNPTELTEGGRRQYSEDDLKKLQLICLLKSFGLSLDSIKGTLESRSPNKILLLLLDEQEKTLGGEIEDKERQLKTIKMVRESIIKTNAIPIETISEMEEIIKNKKKLRKVHGTMLALGIVMDIIQVLAIALWIFQGIWIPFAICMPIVILIGILTVRMYYKNTVYICPECNTTFKPPMKEFFFANHTPKTRKLKCPNCKNVSFCVEHAK